MGLDHPLGQASNDQQNEFSGFSRKPLAAHKIHIGSSMKVALDPYRSAGGVRRNYIEQLQRDRIAHLKLTQATADVLGLPDLDRVGPLPTHHIDKARISEALSPEL